MESCTHILYCGFVLMRVVFCVLLLIAECLQYTTPAHSVGLLLNDCFVRGEDGLWTCCGDKCDKI